jgi:hypothetical protein
LLLPSFGGLVMAWSFDKIVGDPYCE